METNFETTNIHLEWLENIYSELKLIQDMERTAREGCRNLMEYLQIPFENQRTILADVRYKNLKFLAMELDILINNLTPIIEGKVEGYKKRLKPILCALNNRDLFLGEQVIKNRLVEIYVLKFFDKTLGVLISIKSDIIKDLSPILYLKEGETKTW